MTRTSAPALLLALLATACGGGDDEPVAAPPPDRALRLTRDLPDEYRRRVCAEQAQDAPKHADTCPPLIPRGPLKVLHANRFAERPPYRGGFTADLGSRSIDRLRGTSIETNGGHWHFGVAWTPTVARLQVREGVERHSTSCRRTEVAGQPVKACRVKPYERGGGLHGGHVVYTWRTAGTTYLLSMHGYRNEPRVRAMAEAWLGR